MAESANGGKEMPASARDLGANATSIATKGDGGGGEGTTGDGTDADADSITSVITPAAQEDLDDEG